MELRQISKYQVVERIGRGAMGEVYKAFDPVLNRPVAIKTLPAQMGTDAEMRKRFEREAQSAARLNHSNIITVYELGEEAGRIFIVMELLEGRDLKDLIGTETLASLESKLRVMEQVLDGVAFAHAREIVHRDLKPANIRLLPSGQLKVMDFGLARLSGSEMTQAGMVMGTPHYMSPEQVRGEVADARSDVFALGGVFYELFSGQKAFHAESLHGILHKVLETHPAPLRELSPDVPEALVAVIERGLAKEREARFADAGEMLAALREVRGRLHAQGLAEVSGWGRSVIGPAQGRATRRGTATAVAGATALSPRPAEPAATLLERGPRTLDGAGATLLGEAPPRSRAPLYAAAGAVVLLLAGAGIGWRLLHPPPVAAPARDVAGEQAGVLREALLGNRIELARLSLANKSYEEALHQAEQALQVDSQSTEARQIAEQAKAALAERDAVVAEGRDALAKKDVPRASRALTRLLALDPRHPAAGELSAALNASFRSQAEEARRAATAARAGAAGSASSADGFADAERFTREGEALMQTGEYAVATQKYVQARDGYVQAQRVAEAAARRAAAEAQRQAEARGAAEAQREADARRQAEEQRLAAQHQAETQRQADTQRPAETRPTASASTASSAPTPLPAAAPGAADAAIRQVIAEYARAIETKDAALFQAVKPNLSADERRKLEAAFRAIKTQQVRLSIDAIQVSGGQAVVRVSRQDTLNGKPTPAFQQTFRLALTSSGWKIETIGQ